MRSKKASACFSLLAPLSAVAEDASGSFYTGGGVGSVDCPSFVSSMERAKKHGVGSLGYVNEMQGFVMYISGFQTAYNAQTPDTCDIFAHFSDNQLLAWAENYCSNNPLKKYGSAVLALAREVHPRRSRVCK